MKLSRLREGWVGMQFYRVKEQKSPLKGRFYSFQTVGRGAARLKRRRISPSADGDSRLRLKNSRTFEKVRSKLSRCCCL